MRYLHFYTIYTTYECKAANYSIILKFLLCIFQQMNEF